MAGFRKRVFAGRVGPRPMKKTRRPKKRRSGRKTSAFTTQSGHGGGITFKSKLMSKRRYRSLLWNDTLMSTHYRSVAANNTSMIANVNPNLATLAVFNLVDNGAGAFWVTAGGAVAPNAGAVPAVTTQDIILRGGKYGFRITNPDNVTNDPVNITVFIIQTPMTPNLAVLTTPVATSWDPSIVPNFQRDVGRILYKKDFILKDEDCLEVERRLKCRKVDTGIWGANNGTRPILLVLLSSNVAVASGIVVSSYFNLSFSIAN